jgi:hypothetical protein
LPRAGRQDDHAVPDSLLSNFDRLRFAFASGQQTRVALLQLCECADCRVWFPVGEDDGDETWGARLDGSILTVVCGSHGLPNRRRR